MVNSSSDYNNYFSEYLFKDSNFTDKIIFPENSYDNYFKVTVNLDEIYYVYSKTFKFNFYCLYSPNYELLFNNLKQRKLDFVVKDI